MDSILVIDNGSGSTKAGIAGEHLPKSTFPSIVGHLKYQPSILPSSCKIYVGDEAICKKGMCSLKYPIEHGIVSNWSDMEQLLLHTYMNELRVPSEEHAVILTEPSLNPKHNKEKLTEMMFETFNVPSIYIGVQAVLSLYSSAMTTGLVTDIGDGVTHIVPIFDGYSMNHGIQRINLAGRSVTTRLSQLLFESGSRLVSSSDFQTCRLIKETCCYLAQDFDSEVKKSVHDVVINYQLPDGQQLSLDSCRYLAPEILFQPGLAGQDLPGIHEAVYSSIFACDIDVRKELISNVVLSGGTTLIKGFEERFRNEVQMKISGNAKVRVLAPAERNFSVWIGGSVLGSLDSFRTLLLSKEEYFENGNDAVHLKF